MSTVKFEWEELVVLGMFDDVDTKDKAINRLTNVLPHIDDQEMFVVVKGIISKLKKLTNLEFQALELEKYRNLFDEEDE